VELFLFWVVLSGVAGYVASTKGRSAGGFFFLALVLSPLVGLIAAGFAKSALAIEEATVREGYLSQTMRRCPACKEPILRIAVKCKHCGTECEPAPAPKQKPRWWD